MSVVSKLKSLGYEYTELSSYVKKTPIEGNMLWKVIELKNNKPARFYIHPVFIEPIYNSSELESFYRTLKSEYEDTYKDFVDVSHEKSEEQERLDNFIKRVLMTKDIIYPQELDAYKYLLNDLEELERRRKSDICGNEKIKEQLNMTKKVKKNNTPKERVEEFLQECELYEEETNGSAEELPCYKTLVRDLEVLNILKESLNYNFFEKGKLLLGLSEDKYEKVKEWLNEN